MEGDRPIAEPCERLPFDALDDRCLAAELLQRRTADVHRRLEASTGLMSSDLTPARYEDLLVGFARLHQALDRQIAEVLAIELNRAVDRLEFDARCKTPGLRADLADLHLALPPPAPPFRQVSSLAAALGAMYVCEGASLGGRVIAPHVLGVLGAAAPVAFFTSYGSDVGVRWAVFRRSLTTLLTSAAEAETAVACAVAVFDRFDEVLST